MNRRRLTEEFFRHLSRTAAWLIILLLGLLIWVIFKNGLPYMTWEMITQLPKGGYYFGREGGILNAIIGSLYLAGSATALSFVIGIPVVVFMNIYLIKYENLLHNIRFFLDVLWGIPSIVYGAFGFMLMVMFGLRTSLLAGVITLTILVLPIMIRSLDEIVSTAPRGLLEAAFSIGANRTEIGFGILLRYGKSGMITAGLLSFGRAIGDAASVLFTAGFTDGIPMRLDEPAATLPLAIFFQLSSPIPEVRGRAYAAAMVLTIIILVISVLSRIFSGKIKER